MLEINMMHNFSMTAFLILNRQLSEVKQRLSFKPRGVLEVLIDDKEGRKIATRHTLTVRGTLGVLIEFKKLDIVKEI
jgi:hypothetical protein